MKHNWVTWIWRRLNSIGHFRGNAWARDESAWIDVGYCLDRYSIEDAVGNVTHSRP